MIRRSVVAAGAFVGIFHLWLFGQQAWSGQLSDPGTFARWLIAMALAGGLVALRRRGLPLLFSRQAVAMWVLAALLHGPALVNDHDGIAVPALPEAVATLAQAATAVAALGLALLALSWLAAAAASVGPRAVVDGPGVPRVAGLGTTPGFLPRPPPLA